MFERFITRLAFILFGIIVFMAISNEVTDFEINPDGGAMNEITIIQSN
jgi:hypothetical protein